MIGRTGKGGPVRAALVTALLVDLALLATEAVLATAAAPAGPPAAHADPHS